RGTVRRRVTRFMTSHPFHSRVSLRERAPERAPAPDASERSPDSAPQGWRAIGFRPWPAAPSLSTHPPNGGGVALSMPWEPPRHIVRPTCFVADTGDAADRYP